MKNPLIPILLVLIVFSACKKEKQSITGEEKHTASPVWNLNKTWTCDGYRRYASHPSNQDPAHTYTDTTIYTNKPIDVLVIDDTSIVVMLPPATGKDTMWLFKTDNTLQYMEFIPKLFKQIGFRPYGTFLKYYHVKDSIQYYHSDGGVAFDAQTWLHSK